MSIVLPRDRWMPLEHLSAPFFNNKDAREPGLETLSSNMRARSRECAHTCNVWCIRRNEIVMCRRLLIRIPCSLFLSQPERERESTLFAANSNCIGKRAYKIEHGEEEAPLTTRPGLHTDLYVIFTAFRIRQLSNLLIASPWKLSYRKSSIWLSFYLLALYDIFQVIFTSKRLRLYSLLWQKLSAQIFRPLK